MSVKRYDLELEPHSGGQMSEWPTGEYVLYADYAALESLAGELEKTLEDALEVMEIAIHDAHPAEFSMMRGLIPITKAALQHFKERGK